MNGAADIAIIGTADAVARRLASYRDAGATDVVLSAVATMPLLYRTFGTSLPRSSS